jgi:hypothetical protein
MDVIRSGRLSKGGFAFFVGALGCLAGHGALAASLTVPLAAPVPVALTQKLNSETAHVGDPFTFATTKAVTLGTLSLPKGTPGHGRLAAVRAAAGKKNGQLSLQADSLDLPDGDTIWVNVDPTKPLRGRLSDKRTRPILLPLPIGLGAGYTTGASGNMILDAGTAFTVVTIAPRSSPAPLLTPAPSAAPAPAAAPKAGAAPPAPAQAAPSPPAPHPSAS